MNYLTFAKAELSFGVIVIAFLFSLAPVAIVPILDSAFKLPAISCALVQILQLLIFGGVVAAAMAPRRLPIAEMWHMDRAPILARTNRLGIAFFSLLAMCTIQLVGMMVSLEMNRERFALELQTELVLINKKSICFALLFGQTSLLPCVLVGPLVEECIFRGVLLNFLISRMRMALAIAISSLLFGFLHSNFLAPFLAGVLLSVIYLRYGRLSLSIVVHSASNLFALIFLAFAHDQVEVIIQFLKLPETRTMCFVMAILLIWFAIKKRAGTV